MNASISGFNVFLLFMFFLGVGKLALMSGAPVESRAPGLVHLKPPVVVAPKIVEAPKEETKTEVPAGSAAAPVDEWK